jgi:hypothetical protein
MDVLKFFVFVSQIIESKDGKIFNIVPFSKLVYEFRTCLDDRILKTVVKRKEYGTKLVMMWFHQ